MSRKRDDLFRIIVGFAESLGDKFAGLEERKMEEK